MLETLVGGRSDAARTALLDFEARVLASHERSSLAALLAAELSFAESLAAGDVESLIPVMCLHDELYQVYRQRRMFSLIFHTRALIEQLADLYALHGRSQGSRVVAGRVLASLAGHLQDANLPGGSRRLFERSLEYDPKGRAALLGLAVSFEKYGDYRRARAYLETLVAGHPRFSEGLLHLANNLARTAEIVRARELWNRIIELDGPSWVRTLAYQELARSWLGMGDAQKAIALLERALAEAPEQSSTALLLAYAYDRQQQPKRAFELVAQAAASSDAGGRAESARKLYDSWPTLVLEEERRDLAAAAQQRLPLLRQRLDVASTQPKAQEEVAE
ncbi:MAG: tetratricopeptide repeat protein [Thermoanaerobaculia bacterium]|nr:tetratricopeptide repeat protein [Thermoanaerobaculia bacterium]